MMEDVKLAGALWWVGRQLDGLEFLRDENPAAWSDENKATYAKLCCDEHQTTWNRPARRCLTGAALSGNLVAESRVLAQSHWE